MLKTRKWGGWEFVLKKLTSLDAQVNRFGRIFKINPFTGVGQVSLERKRGAIVVLNVTRVCVKID